MKRSGYMYLLAAIFTWNTLDRSKQRPIAPATIRPAASLDLFPLYLHLPGQERRVRNQIRTLFLNKWMDGAVRGVVSGVRAKCANLRLSVVIREDPK